MPETLFANPQAGLVVQPVAEAQCAATFPGGVEVAATVRMTGGGWAWASPCDASTAGTPLR